jgi:hypothetical protein
VLLALPLIRGFVAGAIARLVTASKPSPAVVPRPAWPGNVILLSKVRRRR